MATRTRRIREELEIDHDRWMISYSDLVTLLFAFFVVMYSISQVNESKYRVLSTTLLDVFDVPESSIKPIQVGEPTRSVDPSAIELGEQNRESKENEQPEKQDANLSELANQFSNQFKDLVDDDLLQINGNEMWLELELSSNILFPTGSADPSLQAKGIFEEVAEVLANYNNPVQVEGFTDNIPINNRRFKNNWELSSARAVSVVKLLANNNVDPRRLSAVGYGEFRPIADNTTEEGRSKNRRVMLMISKQATDRPSLQPSDELTNVLGLKANSSTVDTSSEKSNEQGTESAEETITPVKLDNGNLLISSDPELPRNNPVANDTQISAENNLESDFAQDDATTIEEQDRPVLEDIDP